MKDPRKSSRYTEEILRRSAKLDENQLNALSPIMSMLPEEVSRELMRLRLGNRKQGDEQAMALSKELYGKGEKLSRDRMKLQQDTRMAGLESRRKDFESGLNLSKKRMNQQYGMSLDDLDRAKKNARLTTGIAAAGVPIAGLAAYGTAKKEKEDAQRIIDALRRRGKGYYDLDS